MFVEHFMKRRFEEGRLQGLREVREEQYQGLLAFYDALKSEPERLGVEVEPPATPPPPWAIPIFVELVLKMRHQEGRLQGRREQAQQWHEFWDALKSALERQGVDVELPAPPPPP